MDRTTLYQAQVEIHQYHGVHMDRVQILESYSLSESKEPVGKYAYRSGANIFIYQIKL